MGRGQAPWIRSAGADTALALAWIPFALAAFWSRGDGRQLVVLIEALIAFSFVHQPLTLALVYGDAEQFAARRRLWVVGPIVLASVIAVGLTISFTLVAIVGAMWNMEHTLMQRYGFVRIYGRRAGENDGRVERTMLLSWLISTLLWVAADVRTSERVATVPLGQLNGTALDVLTSLRPYAFALLVPSAIVAAVSTGRWIATERGRMSAGTASRAKQRYVVSTAAMFAVAVLIDPVAGFAGFAGAHAIEYFFIVDHRLATSRPTVSRWRFFCTYLIVFEVLYVLARQNDDFYLWVVLFLGGTHFLFDGFIWKSRSTPATPQPIAANVSA
ncbi:MAG: hypothetical protein QOI95_1261 [Acidimicrobiaceae bacterium]